MRLIKALGSIQGALLALLGLLACLVSYVLRVSLPKTRGTILAKGLDGTVEIVRDKWGIPHITAQSRRDLFFACGFVHAQDRLWQLELQRRAASGTLSEIIGEKAIIADRFMRRVGLRRNSESQLPELAQNIRDDLDAYSDGINAFLEATPWWRLPIEFLLLRVKPKPWTPQDSMAFVKLVGFVLAPNWDTQIVRSWLIERLGPKTVAALEPKYVPPKLITPKPGIIHDIEDHLTLLSEYGEVASWIPTAPASNSWAVDGTKSASGAPLIANDTHTPASMPAFWYEIHLKAKNLNVIGVSIPGFPVVIAGHNEHIAWGISSGMVNQQDVFVEQLNPLDPTQYMYEGGWREGTLVRETIKVRGKKKPVVEDILITHHGPIISPEISGAKRALALKSVPLESLGILIAARELMTAENWEEFKGALSHWSAPSMNFVYADTKGHIGWQLAGFIPNRGSRSGLVPARGWTKQDEWSGYIPFEVQPSVYDPPSHMVAAANNRPSDDHQLYFSGEWADSFRIRRITDLLEAKHLMTIGDFEAMQGDVASTAARDLLEFVLNFTSTDPGVLWALQQLRTWDCKVTTDSRAAAIFEVFGYRLYHNIFAEKLGNDIDYYMGKGIHIAAHINALGYRAASNLMRILRALPPDWFNPHTGGPAKTLDEAMELSFKEALTYLSKTMGKNKKKWQWGRIHTVTFPHILEKVPLVGRILNRGPYPLFGDMNTIPQASYDPAKPFSCTASIVTWRHITDCANFEVSESVMPPGASGQPASPYAHNQIVPWLTLSYHPLIFSDETIRKYAKDALTLTPRK